MKAAIFSGPFVTLVLSLRALCGLLNAVPPRPTPASLSMGLKQGASEDGLCKHPAVKHISLTKSFTLCTL